MAAIILKLTFLFLMILAPLFKPKSRKAQMKMKAVIKTKTAVSDFAVGEDGCVVQRHPISNTNN